MRRLPYRAATLKRMVARPHLSKPHTAQGRLDSWAQEAIKGAYRAREGYCTIAEVERGGGRMLVGGCKHSQVQVGRFWHVFRVARGVEIDLARLRARRSAGPPRTRSHSRDLSPQAAASAGDGVASAELVTGDMQGKHDASDQRACPPWARKRTQFPSARRGRHSMAMMAPLPCLLRRRAVSCRFRRGRPMPMLKLKLKLVLVLMLLQMQTQDADARCQMQD